MTAPGNTNTRRRLGFLFCVPLAFSLLFFIANQVAERTDVGLIQLQNLSSSVDRLLSLSKDMDTGEQGFLLTGDERYLVPLQQANAVLPSQKDLCRTYAKDRSESQPMLEKIILLVQKRLDLANKILETQRTRDFTAALDMVGTGAGLENMNEIRQAVFEFNRDLADAQSRYIDRQRTLNNFAFLIFLFGTAIMIIVLVWLYNALVSYIQGRDVAQAELLALNTELETKIYDRTRELQQSNEELQQFAYVASHDLQEPLRTITSFTQLLANRYKGKLDEDADEFISYIVISSRRMTDLINGLLALVRLRKTGQSTIPVSFEKLLEEAEVSLQASIRESDARIEHGPLPSLVVDRVQLTQVLQNLISNAIKYRSERTPHISVQATQQKTDWVFSVADNGQGFEQQYAERIFGIFQRLHGRDVEGTGMGLSIARKIVERHGGRIWAESEPGVGSTFFFSLPASLEVYRKDAEPPAVKSVAPSSVAMKS